ncbi:MAG: response regulator transcription factor, partial [Nocardioides sp.]
MVASLPLHQYGLGVLVEKDPELACGQVVRTLDRITVGPGPRPHIILYYLDDDCLSSIEFSRTLVEHGMEIIVLVSRSSAMHTGAMIRAGVQGVVGCSVDRRELGSAIRHVAGRRRYISPAVASDLLLSPSEPSGGLLTDRERDILVRVASGDTDREIARALGIAVRTVRSHLDNIRKKTGERRRPDLTRFAITHGMWPPPGGHA